MKSYLLYLLLIATPSYGVPVYTYFDKVEGVLNGQLTIYYADLVIEWDFSDKTLNPCYGYTSCSLVAQFYYIDGSFKDHLFYPITQSSRPCMLTVKTLGEFGQCLEGYTTISPNIASNSFTFSNPSKVNYRYGSAYNTYDTVCLKLLLVGNRGWGTEELGPIPGVCGIAPPPLGVCSTPDVVDFDHGTVSVNDIDGNKISKTFNVECNQDLTASISLLNLDNGRLKLSDNLHSSLSINGYPADATPIFNMGTGSNSFSITSELIKSGIVSAGYYQSQTIMVLSIN